MIRVTPRLRMLLVTLVTLGLVFGPCLPALSIFHAGTAHAGDTISHGAPHHGAPAHTLAHGGGSGTHGHHHRGADHHQDGNGSPSSCDDLCQGWFTKKSQRAWALAETGNAFPNSADAKVTLIGADVVSATPLRSTRNIGPVTMRPERRTAIPPFALTNRYRL